MSERLVFTIPEAIETTKIARTKLYEEIGAGRLPIIKIGRRTLIRREALEQWLRDAERIGVPEAA